ncbi:CRAL-TRIO lipid binding domain [Dillenia turbinata]|uniref:CRAL-TRIO lipid binding domain n=1 Tax=Dillenia turbinata TaxID=194707 RepID=A0AAN8V2N5_9MAGN
MEMTQDAAISQLKRSIRKLGSSVENYGDPTLMRFLVARSMDPDKAAKMFVAWQKWRASFVPKGFIAESEVRDELDARKICLQGLSRDGNPVLIVRASLHYPAKDQLQFRKFVVHLLDKALTWYYIMNLSISLVSKIHFQILQTAVYCFLFYMAVLLYYSDAFSPFGGRVIGNEKLIAILDLESLAYKNVDSRGIITGFQLLQDYYPERLRKFFIVNMPWFFVSVWKMVSYFLDRATLEKVVIVSDEDGRKSILEEIGEHVLPERYGGHARLVALQDFTPTPYND